MRAKALRRAVLVWLAWASSFLAPRASAQTPEEYLSFFRAAAQRPEEYDSAAVLREFDRCEFAFVQAPQLGEILRLRSFYLGLLGRCREAWVTAAKAVVVFQIAKESVLPELESHCRSRVPAEESKGLSVLFGLRTAGTTLPSRARRFVLALLALRLGELETCVRREVEWYIAWFPQPLGADSVRAAFGDFLLASGHPAEALSEYISVLEFFDGSKLVPEVSWKAFQLARKLGNARFAQRAIELTERALRPLWLSDAEVSARLLALSRMYLELGEPGRPGLASFARLVDQYRDAAIPPDLLWAYAQRFGDAGDTTHALLCLRLLVDRYPSDPRSTEARTLMRRLGSRIREDLQRAFPPPPPRELRFRPVLAPSEIAAIKSAFLSRINADRRRLGLAALAMDSLATAVADSHCMESLRWGYSGDLDLRGLKPYHRYALTGGYHALSTSFLSGTWRSFRTTAQRLLEVLVRTHERMLEGPSESNPYRTHLLSPEHNRCGIGLAVGPHGYRLEIAFLNAYVSLDPLPTQLYSVREAERETLWVTGAVREGVQIVGASLGFEPWPRPVSPEEITSRESHPSPVFYTSLGKLESVVPEEGGAREALFWFWKPWSGFRFVFTEDGRRFRLPVVFHRGGPGIYTLTIWVRREKIPREFPATYLCFFVM